MRASKNAKNVFQKEAERAGVQAHAPDVVHMADDEDTEDDEAFNEQELLRKAQEKIHAKHMDRLARVKIDRYRLVGEDKLLVKQCVYRSAKSKQPTVAWPAVVPEPMIPTILSLSHGAKSILHHAGKHKTYRAMRNRFVWKA